MLIGTIWKRQQTKSEKVSGGGRAIGICHNREAWRGSAF